MLLNLMLVVAYNSSLYYIFAPTKVINRDLYLQGGQCSEVLRSLSQRELEADSTKFNKRAR